MSSNEAISNEGIVLPEGIRLPEAIRLPEGIRSREGIGSREAIQALRAAGSALGDVDVSGWDDSALTDQLAELSDVLCQLDAQLSRVAEAVRARGFRIAEPVAA